MTRIVQLTDPHLGADANYRLAGVNTQATFTAVLEEVKKEQFELIMITGDIAADANIEAYGSFFGSFACMDTPMIWLPGNHDLMDAISGLENAIPFVDYYDAGMWRIIMLDSVIEYSPNGRLGPDELDKLKRLLAENTRPHVLVSLHHPPVDVGCAWLDNHKIEDCDEFLQIVESDERVRFVLWGHIHQEFSTIRNGRLFAATPSTCIQFKANSDDFALDELYPGYRMIELKDDGSIETQVKRVELQDYDVDINCMGY